MTYYFCDCTLSNLLTILSFNQHTDSYLPVNLDVSINIKQLLLQSGQLETAKCGELGGKEFLAFIKHTFVFTRFKFMSFAFSQEKGFIIMFDHILSKRVCDSKRSSP